MKTCIAILLCLTAAFAPRVASAAGEQQFSSSDEAINALATAAKANDTNALHAIFGPAAHELASADPVQASNSLALFEQRAARKIKTTSESGSKIVLEIGSDLWPFPIPLVKADEHWYFDTEAGKEEILNRRIGMNELGAIRVCHAYVEAQREYASQEHDNEGVIEFAQLLRSTKGRHDGLYWHAATGEDLSPFGPLIAQSHDEGYHADSKIMTSAQTPFNGYCFKILTSQGAHAPGGAYSYVINEHMVAGFALVAWPAEWGNSGVMTFIVNQNGRVFQKNLGVTTETAVIRMSTYNPDPSWTPVQEH